MESTDTRIMGFGLRRPGANIGRCRGSCERLRSQTTTRQRAPFIGVGLAPIRIHSRSGTSRSMVCAVQHRPSRPPLQPVWRWLLIAAGWLCVGLAAAGVVLPLLPTTPFLLLAAACFSRSSERFYRWLLNNRHFGPLLLQWRENRSVSLRSKRVAQVMLVVTFGSTCMWFVPNDIARVVLAVFGLTMFVIVSRLRVADPADVAATCDELCGADASRHSTDAVCSARAKTLPHTELSAR